MGTAPGVVVVADGGGDLVDRKGIENVPPGSSFTESEGVCVDCLVDWGLEPVGDMPSGVVAVGTDGADLVYCGGIEDVIRSSTEERGVDVGTGLAVVDGACDGAKGG